MNAPHISGENVQEGEFRFDDADIPLGCVPFVIEDLVTQWPAFNNWNIDYLKTKFGKSEVTCFVTRKNDRTFLQQVNRSMTIPFREFLDHIFTGSDGDSSGGLFYLRIPAEHPLFAQLAEDIKLPDFLDSFNPDATGIWMGQKGNITPFHHDWWHSFLVQIAGKKRYFIVHPFEGVNLQEEWSDAQKYDLRSAPVLTADEFSNKDYDIGFTGTLHAGEILYIPPFWFHQIDTLDDGNISMPLRHDTSQTPDLDLFQFNQDMNLREITNKNTIDEQVLRKYLAMNRERFFAKEQAFIQAFVEARNVNSSCEEIVDALNEHHLNGALE